MEMAKNQEESILGPAMKQSRLPFLDDRVQILLKDSNTLSVNLTEASFQYG